MFYCYFPSLISCILRAVVRFRGTCSSSPGSFEMFIFNFSHVFLYSQQSSFLITAFLLRFLNTNTSQPFNDSRSVRPLYDTRNYCIINSKTQWWEEKMQIKLQHRSRVPLAGKSFSFCFKHWFRAKTHIINLKLSYFHLRLKANQENKWSVFCIAFQGGKTRIERGKKTSEHEVMFMRLAYGRSKKTAQFNASKVTGFSSNLQVGIGETRKNKFDMLCNSHAIDMKSKQQSPQQCVRDCSWWKPIWSIRLFFPSLIVNPPQISNKSRWLFSINSHTYFGEEKV